MISGTWTVLVALVGIVLALARIRPDEAKSNLAKWIEAAGFHNVPAWIRSPTVARWIFRVGLVVMIILAVSGVVSLIMDQPRRSPGVPPVVEGPVGELPPLSKERKQSLIDALTPLKNKLPEVVVVWPQNAGVEGYARELAGVFERAGITPGLGGLNPGGPNETGIMIAAKNPDKLPEAAQKIFEIFKANGLRPKVVPLAPKIGAEFVVFVGPKPL